MNVEPADDRTPANAAPALKPGSGRWKTVVALLFLAGISFLALRSDNRAVLDYLASQESLAREFRARHPVGIHALAFLLYVAVTGLSLPGATPLTILYGWFFDLWPALVLISFASTAGATLAFLMSRYLLKNTVEQRFGDRLQTINAALEREGAWYLFSLRLLPAVPFFVINLVMGLTPMRVATYWWVSQLGMLPGTVVYTYVGHSFPSIAAIQEVVARDGFRGLLDHSSGSINLTHLLVALMLLGLLPVVLRFIVKKIRPETSPSSPSDARRDA